MSVNDILKHLEVPQRLLREISPAIEAAGALAAKNARVFTATDARRMGIIAQHEMRSVSPVIEANNHALSMLDNARHETVMLEAMQQSESIADALNNVPQRMDLNRTAGAVVMEATRNQAAMQALTNGGTLDQALRAARRAGLTQTAGEIARDSVGAIAMMESALKGIDATAVSYKQLLKATRSGVTSESVELLNSMQSKLAKRLGIVDGLRSIPSAYVATEQALMGLTPYTKILSGEFKASEADATNLSLAIDSEALSEVIDQLDSTDGTLFDKLNITVVVLKKTEDSVVRRILEQVLVSLLVGILLVYATPLLPTYKVAMSPREAQTIVHEAVESEETSPSDAITYRVTFRDMVKVKASRKRKAPVAGRLRSGEIVRVVEKRRKQCLIEWYSEDASEVVIGWVPSKYLRRIVR